MTEPINTTNAITDEDDNPEQHTGARIPDHDEPTGTESGDQSATGEGDPA